MREYGYTIEEVNDLVEHILKDYQIKLHDVIMKKANEYGMEEVEQPTQSQEETMLIMRGMRKTAKMVLKLRLRTRVKQKEGYHER